MIEKGLNQHNIMPGTERYTRPEEVKALNRFLKSVKEIQEEHTSLEENNLELPRVPEVNDLDSRRVDVSGDIKKVDRLEEGRLGIHGEEIKNLSMDRENLIDSRENNLEDSKITIENPHDTKLSGDRISLDGGDSVDLEETRVNLKDDSENNLEDSKITIEDPRKIKLQETRLEIETPGVKDLWRKNVKIDPTTQDQKLENYKETIKDARENSLEDIVLDINAPEISDLRTSKVNIESTKEIKNLPEDRENIETPEVNNLPKDSINISGAKEYELEDTRLDITGNEISDLPDVLDKIETSEIKNLPADKERIETPKITHLSEDRENIEVPEVSNLETNRENIETKEIGSLEDFVDTIETKQSPGLSEELKTISPTEIKSLPEDRKNIEVPEVGNLETNQENIETQEVGKLEDDIKTIQGKEISDLPNSSISISPRELTNLENHRENIETPEIKNLSEDKKNIEVPEVENLEDHRESIETTGVNNLKSHLETIETKEVGGLGDRVETLSSPNQINSLPGESLSIQGQDISSLEEKRIDITSAQDINSLPEGSESISPENKIENIEDHKETLSGTSEPSSLETKVIEGPEKVEKELETTRLDISENTVESLGDTLVQGPIINNPENLEDKIITVESNEIDSLEDFILGLNDSRENTLETRVIQEPTRNEPKSLEETIISLGKPEDQELENNREDLEDIREESLEDTLIDLGGVSGYSNEGGSNFFWEDKLREEKLSRPVDPGVSGRTTTSEDYKTSKVEIKDTIISSPESADLSGRTYRKGYGYKTGDILETKIIEGPEENEQDLDETVIDRPINSDQTNRTLTDSKYEVSEIKELIDTYLKRPRNTGHPRKTESLSDKYIEAKENLEEGKVVRPDSSDKFDETLEDGKILRPENTEHQRKTAKSFSDKYEEAKENLEEGKVARPDNSDQTNRTITDSEYEVSEIKELIDTYLKRPDNSYKINRTITDSEYEVSGGEELINTYLKRPENLEHSRKTESLSDKYEEAKENLEDGKIIRPENTSHPRKTEHLSDKYIEAIETLEDGKIIRPENLEHPRKTEHLSDKYEKAEETLEEGYVDTPRYELPKIGWKNFWSGGALNPSTYLRQAVDLTVGSIPLKGAMKRKLIDETLKFLVWGREALEKKTKANRDRLPGGDMGILSDLVGGSLSVKSAAKSVLGALSKTVIDRSQPLNRPKDEKDKQTKWEAIGQYVYDTTNPVSRENKTKGGGNFFKDVGKSLMGGSKNNASESETRQFTQLIGESYKYENPGRVVDDDFIGFGQTINDLISSKADLTSLEDFKKALRESRYITTPEKFTTTRNSTNYMTLDSNHVWEIIVKPYLGKLNGGYTWLPSFLEMDVQNKLAFNMTTSFSRGWLPITGFELQDKKLTSKELPLFDGSISFPVGLEFTNELRLTFADDSLKSLRRYFDLCAKVSAYMSNIHKEGEPGYGSASENENSKEFYRTVYLEGKIHPGLYKNLSFLITIFILTPQYGTIKKCNLLCVLKDYIIENQGETDASPTELSVTFSIVGENPGDGIDLKQESAYTPAKKTGQTDRTGEGILDNLGSVVDIF